MTDENPPSQGRDWLLRSILLLSVAAAAGLGIFVMGTEPDKVDWLWVGLAAGFCVLGVFAPATALTLRLKTRTERSHAKRLETELNEIRNRQPTNTMAGTSESWELARVKLEAYLNRNLDQVRVIFWIAVLIIGAGFVLISFGVLMIFQGKIDAAMVGSASGVLVEFIGASVLKLYASIMSQARNNVRVLERINAVGMAVRILDGVDHTTSELKQNALVDVSRSLLAMYGELGEPPAETAAPSVADQISAS